MYDVVLRASALFLVGYKNTIFSLLSLRGDDPVYLFVLLNVASGHGRFTIIVLAMVLMEFPALYLRTPTKLFHERVSVGKVTCSL
jgi:hypothetical protein